MCTHVFRCKGTVLQHVWWQVIFVEIYSALIVYVHFNYYSIEFSQIIIDILGVVTGLLLAFRTQTAYERYSGGRLVWSEMHLHIRNLTRAIWTLDSHNAKCIIEKKSTINLLLAFAVAVKHYLREEYGYKFEDLKHLISHITTAHMNEHDVGLLHGGRGIDITTMRDVICNNIPIEISYYIASYINHCREKKTTDILTISNMQKGLSKLVGCLTSFERIRRTPIPLAYSVHLAHLTWLYTLSIPLQIVNQFGWYTLFIEGFAAFAFLGILEIGKEIENPFGYQPNDLPLDKFCEEIRMEIDHVLMQAPIKSDTWIFSSKNTPFIPKSLQNAIQLSERSVEEINGIINRASEIAKNKTNINV